MPPFETFRDAESYYATLAHEMTHWTRHPKRLERDFGRKRWGDEGYAMEELVAELGSAFLSADLDLTPEVRADHASYIGNLAQGAERRQAGDLHRRRPRATRRRLPERAATRRAAGGGRMSRPDNIIIDGRAYRWRDIVELRRQQLEAWKAARPEQPALFALKEDCRPAAERSAAGRYREPSLLDRARRD